MSTVIWRTFLANFTIEDLFKTESMINDDKMNQWKQLDIVKELLIAAQTVKCLQVYLSAGWQVYRIFWFWASNETWKLKMIAKYDNLCLKCFPRNYVKNYTSMLSALKWIWLRFHHDELITSDGEFVLEFRTLLKSIFMKLSSNITSFQFKAWKDWNIW